MSLNGHVGRSNMPSEGGEKTTYPVKQEQVGQEVTLMLSLHNGEVVTFDDLPEGTSYAVVEDEQPYRNMGFTVSYADGNSSTTEKNKGNDFERNGLLSSDHQRARHAQREHHEERARPNGQRGRCV